MPRSRGHGDGERLRDIHSGIDTILRWTSERDHDEPVESEVVREPPVIGEEAKHPAHAYTASRPTVPRRETVGFRNLATHGCRVAAWRIVAETAFRDLPVLRQVGEAERAG